MKAQKHVTSWKQAANKEWVEEVFKRFSDRISALENEKTGSVEISLDPIVCKNPELFNRWNGRIDRKVSDTDTAIETIRTKTAEIESAQKAVDDAKEFLRAKGVEYVGVKVESAPEPEVGMSDWRKWKVGDLIESLDDSQGSITAGEIYTIESLTRSLVEVKNNFGHILGYFPRRFKFHSRPSEGKAKCQ